MQENTPTLPIRPAALAELTNAARRFMTINAAAIKAFMQELIDNGLPGEGKAA